MGFNAKALVVAGTLGLVLSADAQEVKVQPGKGVSFKGENVAMSMGGRIQARHEYDQAKERGSFSTPRVRLALKGSFYENWKWAFQSDFAKKGSATLKDGLIEYAASDEVNVRVGQYKVGFDRQNLESSGSQTFVDRSIASRALGIGRDVGLMVHGRAAEKLFQYNAGVYNGGGEGGSNKPNRMPLMVGRVSINPLGDFGLSQSDIKKSDKQLVFVDGSVAWQSDSGETSKGTMRYVAGAGYRFAGIYVAGEYFGLATSSETKSDGFYAQASYMVIGELLELAARYSMIDPDKDGDGDLRSEIMGGFNVYFNKMGHKLKLTADAAGLKDEEKGDEFKVRTRIQAQLVF